jgi:hypothetical protein
MAHGDRVEFAPCAPTRWTYLPNPSSRLSIPRELFAVTGAVTALGGVVAAGSGVS